MKRFLKVGSIVSSLVLALVLSACGKHDFYSYGESSISGSSMISDGSSEVLCPNPIPLDTFDMPEISSSHRWNDGSSGSWKLVRQTMFVVHERSGNSFAGEVIIQRTPSFSQPEVAQRILCNGVRDGATMRGSTKTVESISMRDGRYTDERASEFQVNEFGGYTLDSTLRPLFGYTTDPRGPAHGLFTSIGDPALISSRVYRRSYREVEIRVRINVNSNISEDRRMTMHLAFVYQVE